MRPTVLPEAKDISTGEIVPAVVVRNSEHLFSPQIHANKNLNYSEY